MPQVLPRRLRRLWAVAVLPLLVCMLSGWSSAGAWFCESGAQCEPGSSLTCCCGASVRPDDCCTPGSQETEASASHHCGCYYQSHSIEARGAQAGPRLTGPPAVPAYIAVAIQRPLPVQFALAPEPLAPPGSLPSAAVTRGPPNA
jgi:hypothetical protein